MNAILASVNSMAGVVLAAVLNNFWLALGVVAVVWLALKLLSRTRVSGLNAATRYSIWWAVLVVVLVLPLAPRLAGLFHPRMQSSAEPSAHSSVPKAALLPPIVEPAVVTVQPERVGTWPLWVFGVWAAILLFRLAQLARSYVFLRGAKRRASVALLELPNCGVQRPVQLLLSDEISSPMAVGFLKPAVMLPEPLLAELDEPELDHVLLHELAHIARRDDWTNLAARLAGAALALHPVALWILRQIEREREMACDDFVVAQTGEARPYAKSLARMVELRWSKRGEVLSSGIFGNSSKLGDRIESLLQRGHNFSPRTSLKRVAISTAVLCSFAMAGSFARPWIAFAQPEPRPEFEVASVRPSAPNDRPWSLTIQPGGRLSVTNVPLKTLIGYAYSAREHQVAGGPGWLESFKYDIEAKPDPAVQLPAGPLSPANDAPIRRMMQSLLAERFKLVVHRGSKELPVFELVLAKGGPKFDTAADTDIISRGGSMSGGRGLIHSQAAAMPMLVSMLERNLGRSVIDKTGLLGKYDFELKWTPEAGAGGDERSATPAADGPTLFTAIQDQLGLKFESAKGPVEIIAIDHVEKADAN